jgi:hypothetical protein
VALAADVADVEVLLAPFLALVDEDNAPHWCRAGFHLWGRHDFEPARLP